MAKFQMIKHAGGVLTPADEIEEESLKKLKNDGLYEIDINVKINPVLHRKMFAFFKFCFQYWRADNGFQEFANEKTQFIYFRKQLLINAGHCEMVFDLKDPSKFIVVAKSISYKELDDEILRRDLFVAITQAAIDTIFKDCRDEDIINRLRSFF